MEAGREGRRIGDGEGRGGKDWREGMKRRKEEEVGDRLKIIRPLKSCLSRCIHVLLSLSLSLTLSLFLDNSLVMEIKTVLLLGCVTAGFTTKHSTVTCVAGVDSGTLWTSSEDVAHPPVLTSLIISRVARTSSPVESEGRVERGREEGRNRGRRKWWPIIVCSS